MKIVEVCITRRSVVQIHPRQHIRQHKAPLSTQRGFVLKGTALALQELPKIAIIFLILAPTISRKAALCGPSRKGEPGPRRAADEDARVA